MKAVVFHGIGDIRLDEVPDPKLQDDTDAVLRITTSAICGTDLHFVRGTMPGMKPGRIVGHEAVGVVEELGKGVRNFREGERVVVGSTIGCGYCSYCRAGYFSKCDNANPMGKRAGAVFFGGPEESGGIDGLQAEKARIPFANVTMVKLPDHVSDDQAILLSDIFPTGYFGAHLADIEAGNTVCVLGCGPVGQFAIASAKLMGAGRVLAVDCVPSRLEMARLQGAEVVNFEQEDPVETVVEITGGIGVDRVIDAVGIDAQHAHHGPAGKKAKKQSQEFEQELETVAPKQHPQGDNWHPGDGPSQAIRWGVQILAKAGTHAIIGVYPKTAQFYPIGEAMGKNITVKAGDCNHRRYLPRLVDLVASGAFDPAQVLTQREPITDAIAAYEAFDRREAGWIKVELEPRGKNVELGDTVNERAVTRRVVRGDRRAEA
ncbi:MAG TPA: zinc-dependent alcohol dehydrogenase [Gemmatimonadaceae bacterium]|nr:zinc-dependent alcohol dehydrogenase [Gemmatimonadaceae bacterium]